MEPNLFRNRWLALAFVALVAIGAVALVGGEDQGGLLDSYVTGRPVVDPEPDAPVEEEEAAAEVPSSELLRSTPVESAPVRSYGSFASEDELLDEAEGFDASPMIVHDEPDHEGTVLEAEGETVIVESDVAGSEF